MITLDFKEWGKTERFDTSWEVTEKIDGTNALIIVDCPEEGGPLRVRAGSRTRLITPEADNYGFAAWVRDHEQELQNLGVGYHYGEWYGAGIQRRYDLQEKRLALFSSKCKELPSCVTRVPLVGSTTQDGLWALRELESLVCDFRDKGSLVAPGFMNTEGVVLRHCRSNTRLKLIWSK